jgi:phosphoribosylformylglycinamidine (FGAM) synthase-like enzyme
MAIAGKIGAKIDAAPTSIVPHAWWFGEDQGRYLVTVAEDQVESILAKTSAVGVPCARIGTTGGAALDVAGVRAIAVAKLSQTFEQWFPAYMRGEVAA